MKKRTLLILIVLAVALLVTVSCKKDSETIRIVHKNYTEQRLVGEMFSVYLDSKGFKTEVKELGGSMLCFNAIMNNDADLYPEYTGTAYSAVLNQKEILGADETYDYVKSEFEKQYEITWLKPLGFNNTYVLSVTKAKAEEYNLKTISDLAPYAKDWLLGGDQEFGVRESDGYPAVQNKYGFSFKKYNGMDQGLTYTALVNGNLDVNSSFATDGRIQKYNLINLEDDKQVFPPYYCTPIMKIEFAEKNPKVVEALNALENVFSDEDMQKYNLMVDEGAIVHNVAVQMLEDKNLI